MDCSMHLWEAGIYFGTVPGLHEQSHFLLRIHFFKIYPFNTAILSYFILSDLFIFYPINFGTPFALHAQYDRPPQVKFLRGFVLKVSILNKIRRVVGCLECFVLSGDFIVYSVGC